MHYYNLFREYVNDRDETFLYLDFKTDFSGDE